MYVDGLLPGEATEGGVTADLGDVEGGAGGERFAFHRVDAEGEPDDGTVERLVELQPAYDAGRAADPFHLTLSCGDDYVSLWGTHRLAALRGDHTRLHASLGDSPGEALPDALGEI
jgi:hypothetical protein